MTKADEKKIQIMIKVLQDWPEIGVATKYLGKNSWPKHESAEKNWDCYQLARLVESMPPESRMIDLGCGDTFIVRLLSALGFKNIHGIDLSISCVARLRQFIKMWRAKSLQVPFHLRKADITQTGFPANHFDLATCVSVIEHGVDLEKFLAESNRILKPGGVLFITTDYWPEEINDDSGLRPYNLPWKIFSKKDIEKLIEQATDFGFSLYKETTIPSSAEKCVAWNGQEYTFINIIFKKK